MMRLDRTDVGSACEAMFSQGKDFVVGLLEQGRVMVAAK